MTVDAEGDIGPRSWISAIRMYAMQASFAYLNVTYDDRRPHPLGTGSEYVSSGPLSTPASLSSAFPDLVSHPKARSRSLGYLKNADPQKHTTTKFYPRIISVFNTPKARSSRLKHMSTIRASASSGRVCVPLRWMLHRLRKHFRHHLLGA